MGSSNNALLAPAFLLFSVIFAKDIIRPRNRPDTIYNSFFKKVRPKVRKIRVGSRVVLNPIFSRIICHRVVIPRLDAYHLDGLLGLTIAEAYSMGQITLNDVVNAVLSAEKLKIDVALDPLLSSRVDSILAGFLQNSSDK